MRRRAAPSSYQVWWRKHPDWIPGRGCIFLYSPFAAAPVRFSQLHSFCFIRCLSLPPSSLPTAARKGHKIRYAFSRPPGKGVVYGLPARQGNAPVKLRCGHCFTYFSFFFSGCFCNTVFARKLPDHYTLPSPRVCATNSRVGKNDKTSPPIDLARRCIRADIARARWEMVICDRTRIRLEFKTTSSDLRSWRRRRGLPDPLIVSVSFL